MPKDVLGPVTRVKKKMRGEAMGARAGDRRRQRHCLDGRQAETGDDLRGERRGSEGRAHGVSLAPPPPRAPHRRQHRGRHLADIIGKPGIIRHNRETGHNQA